MEMEIEVLLICKNRKDILLVHGIVTYFLKKGCTSKSFDKLMILLNIACWDYQQKINSFYSSVVFGLFLRHWWLMGLVILKYLDIQG